MCTAHAKIIKIIFLNSIYHKIILLTHKYDSPAIFYLQLSFSIFINYNAMIHEDFNYDDS